MEFESVSDAQLRTLLVNLNSALTASLASPFTQSDATTDSLIQLVDYVSKHKPAPYADAILFSNAPPMSPKTPSRTLFDGLNAPSSDNQAASDMQNIQTVLRRARDFVHSELEHVAETEMKQHLRSVKPKHIPSDSPVASASDVPVIVSSIVWKKLAYTINPFQLWNQFVSMRDEVLSNFATEQDLSFFDWCKIFRECTHFDIPILQSCFMPNSTAAGVSLSTRLAEIYLLPLSQIAAQSLIMSRNLHECQANLIELEKTLLHLHRSIASDPAATFDLSLCLSQQKIHQLIRKESVGLKRSTSSIRFRAHFVISSMSPFCPPEYLAANPSLARHSIFFSAAAAVSRMVPVDKQKQLLEAFRDDDDSSLVFALLLIDSMQMFGLHFMDVFRTVLLHHAHTQASQCATLLLASLSQSRKLPSEDSTGKEDVILSEKKEKTMFPQVDAWINDCVAPLQSSPLNLILDSLNSSGILPVQNVLLSICDDSSHRLHHSVAFPTKPFHLSTHISVLPRPNKQLLHTGLTALASLHCMQLQFQNSTKPDSTSIHQSLAAAVTTVVQSLSTRISDHCIVVLLPGLDQISWQHQRERNFDFSVPSAPLVSMTGYLASYMHSASQLLPASLCFRICSASLIQVARAIVTHALNLAPSRANLLVMSHNLLFASVWLRRLAVQLHIAVLVDEHGIEKTRTLVDTQKFNAAAAALPEAGAVIEQIHLHCAQLLLIASLHHIDASTVRQLYSQWKGSDSVEATRLDSKQIAEICSLPCSFWSISTDEVNFMLSFQSIPFSVLSHLSICNQLSASIHPVLSSQLDQVSMFAEQVVRSFGSLMSKSTAHSVLSHRTDLRPNDYPELASDQQSAADALRDALLL